MKLYDWDFAPNCRRVRMFLLEKGIEIPREECITPEIELKGDYIGHYKHAMVPMLELDDGTQLGEALSIWLYLETVVSRRHFFCVAPDWRHVTGTMRADLGELRGFVGERR